MRRFNQYVRQNALVSADPFGDSDWHGCLVVAGASSSLGAYVRFLLISLMLPPVAPQRGVSRWLVCLFIMKRTTL